MYLLTYLCMLACMHLLSSSSEVLRSVSVLSPEILKSIVTLLKSRFNQFIYFSQAVWTLWMSSKHSLPFICYSYSFFWFCVFLTPKTGQLSFYIIRFFIDRSHIYHFLCSSFLFNLWLFFWEHIRSWSLFFRYSSENVLGLGVKYFNRCFHKILGLHVILSGL